MLTIGRLNCSDLTVCDFLQSGLRCMVSMMPRHKNNRPNLES